MWSSENRTKYFLPLKRCRLHTDLCTFFAPSDPIFLPAAPCSCSTSMCPHYGSLLVLTMVPSASSWSPRVLTMVLSMSSLWFPPVYPVFNPTVQPFLSFQLQRWFSFLRPDPSAQARSHRYEQIVQGGF